MSDIKIRRTANGYLAGVSAAEGYLSTEYVFNTPEALAEWVCGYLKGKEEVDRSGMKMEAGEAAMNGGVTQ